MDILFFLVGAYVIIFMGIMAFLDNSILAILTIVVGIGVIKKNVIARYLSLGIVVLSIFSHFAGIAMCNELTSNLQNQITTINVNVLEGGEVIVPKGVLGKEINLENASRDTDGKVSVDVETAEKYIKQINKSKNFQFYPLIVLNILVALLLVSPEFLKLK